MRVRHVKLIWGATRSIKGRWFLGLFGLYSRVEGKPEDALAISLRGLALWLLGLGLAAYVAGATAVFWIWQRNPYSVLTYQDALLYPLRRATLAEKQGQAFIAQGRDLYRAKKYHDAANLLRLGLARYPRDLRARLLLAQYYLLTNQHPIAQRILQEGMTNDYPGRAYLDTMVSVAEQGEDYDLAVRTYDRYLARLKADGPVRDYRWFSSRKFAALTAAGRHADALALAEAEGPGEQANEHRVLALLGLKRAAEAVTFLAEWHQRPGANLPTVSRLQVRALREAVQFEGMEAALAELRGLARADPATMVDAVVQQAMAGRLNQASAALDEYLFRFGGSAANLVLLAEPLAEIDQPELLRRCVAAAAERGYPLQRFQTLLVASQLRHAEWDAAGRLLAAMAPVTGRDAQQARVWRDWTQRLLEAAATPSDTAQLSLGEFMRSRPWPIALFRRTVDSLILAERWETARDITAAAVRIYPASAWVRSQGDAISAALAASAITKAPATVVPVRQLGEKIFVQRLDDAVHAQRWEGASQLMKELRAVRPEPPWLPAREAGFRLTLVRINHGLGDQAGALAAARLFLNGDNERSRQMLELAREFATAGDKDSGLALTREVLRRTPNHPPAVRLLAELNPPPAGQPLPKTKAPSANK